ncbi:hypothetical protein VSR34_06855 [Paraburkholderia sp. JHI2823]|uniref:hypothetical protein n=1 Tax=Paraburkholderia TaxID=1822464 RepID=UPI0012DFD1DC|nr:hypothetical protein [Paraburkholderia mimosarum]
MNHSQAGRRICMTNGAELGATVSRRTGDSTSFPEASCLEKSANSGYQIIMQQGKRPSAVRKSTYMDSNGLTRCDTSRFLVKQAVHSILQRRMEALSMP